MGIRMKDFGPDPFFLTAYPAAVHEAGHVILWLKHDFPFERVWVRSDPSNGDEGSGMVEGRVFSVSNYGAAARALLEITVAGFLAEALESEAEEYGHLLSGRERRARNAKVGINPLGSLHSRFYETTLPFLFSAELDHRLPSGNVEAAGMAEFDDLNTDLCFVHDLTKRISRGSRSALFNAVRRAEKSAESTLKQEWHRLKRLVWSLTYRRNGTMTYKQVVQLIGKGEVNKSR